MPGAALSLFPSLQQGCGSGWVLPGSGSYPRDKTTDPTFGKRPHPTLEKTPDPDSTKFLPNKIHFYFFLSVIIVDILILHYRRIRSRLYFENRIRIRPHFKNRILIRLNHPDMAGSDSATPVCSLQHCICKKVFSKEMYLLFDCSSCSVAYSLTQL